MADQNAQTDEIAALKADIAGLNADIADLKAQLSDALKPRPPGKPEKQEAIIGTAVQYFGEKEVAGADGVHAAIVTAIEDDGTADLHIFFRNSSSWFRTGVPQDSIPEGSKSLGYWRWPE